MKSHLVVMVFLIGSSAAWGQSPTGKAATAHPKPKHDMANMPGMKQDSSKSGSPPEHQMQDMPGMKQGAGTPQQPGTGMQNMPGMAGQDAREKPQELTEQPVTNIPKIGEAETFKDLPRLSLDQAERSAMEHNPTLAEAKSAIRAASGRSLQSGLYPNPMVGYSGEEIRGGSKRGGQQGGFIEQNIVLGNKLSLSRSAAQQDVKLAEIESEEQMLRVMNGVRGAYYDAMAVQEMVALSRRYLLLAQDAERTAIQLRNIGQFDDTEILQAQIERQRAELEVKRQNNQWQSAWTTLAVAMGQPDTPLSVVEGQLDADLPSGKDAEMVDRIVRESPAVRIAETGVSRAEAMLARARRESIPDLRLRAGLQQNRELQESTGRPIGLQGFAEVGVQIPIFNRNQGNIQSGIADVERSRNEQRRISLLLRQRASFVLRAYKDAVDTSQQYKTNMIPAAQKSYELMLNRWGEMAASYPQLLSTQRTLFELQRDYITSLQSLRATAIALSGFLVTDALEAPTRPGEVDQPVREVNLPTSTSQR